MFKLNTIAARVRGAKHWKKGVVAAGVAAAFVVGGVAGPGLAEAATNTCTWGSYPLCKNSVASLQVVDGSLTGTDIQNGALGQADFDAATNAKINALPVPGPAGPAGPAGPQGPAGQNGNDAILSVTAASSLTDRPDSGLHGTWAKDNMTRTVVVTRQKAAKASNCGGGATKCWFYTGSIVDNGTFATVAGGKSPQAGLDIAGTVNGSVAGASQIEFFASSDAPNPALVDATVVGAAHPTGEWVKMFFPAGTVVTDTDLLDWAWTYTAPGTCEKWVNAKAGNTGDIAGVNAC